MSRFLRSRLRANETITRPLLNFLLMVLLVLSLIPSVLATSALNSYKKTISGHRGNNHENRISRIDASSLIPSQSNAFPLASFLPSPTPNTNREYLSESSFVGSLVGDGTLDDGVVDDFILVSTIDGSLHALDRKTGLELWSIPGENHLFRFRLQSISKTFRIQGRLTHLPVKTVI